MSDNEKYFQVNGTIKCTRDMEFDVFNLNVELKGFCSVNIRAWSDDKNGKKGNIFRYFSYSTSSSFSSGSE